MGPLYSWGPWAAAHTSPYVNLALGRSTGVFQVGALNREVWCIKKVDVLLGRAHIITLLHNDMFILLTELDNKMLEFA